MNDPQTPLPAIGDTLTANGVPCTIVDYKIDGRMPSDDNERVLAAGRAAGVLVTTTDAVGDVGGPCALCPFAADADCPYPLPCGDYHIVPTAALPFLHLEGVLT